MSTDFTQPVAMAKNRNVAKKQTHRSFRVARTAFERTLRSNRNLWSGLAKARINTEARFLPAIVTDLGRKHLLSSVIVGNPFPKTFGDFRQVQRVADVDAAKEFICSSAVLSLFKDELANFVSYRLRFEEQFIGGALAT